MLVLLIDDRPIMYSSYESSNFLLKFFDDIFGYLQFLSYEQKLLLSWGM